MPLPQSIRSLIPLVIGLAVGGVGATMFWQSLPGAEGSPEERAARLEVELKRAKNKIMELEATSSADGSPLGALQRLAGSHDNRRTLKDGMRGIAEDLREGRPVSPEDVFRASQPLMRDLAPLFDRMRLKQQQDMVDSLAGEMARKYDLAPAQQEILKQFFAKRANEEAKLWSDMIGRDGTRLEDVLKASRDVRPDEGLDAIMPSVLSGEKLTQFKSGRLAERASRVEADADRRVQRLDGIVQLDEAQRDQVFGIMARNSKDYDPQMVMEGKSGSISAYPTGNPQQAMLGVLRPEQRAAYDAEQKRRREAAEKDFAAIGLTMPPEWDMFEDFH